MIELYLVGATLLIFLILYKLLDLPKEAFLKLQRIDWWGLTYIPIISGYLIGGGTLLSVEFISLTVLTFLWHGVVYSHNDLQDYFHDKESEESRRPLQNYSEYYEDAVVLFNINTLLVFLTAFLFSILVSKQDLASISILFLAVILGHAYNDSSFGNYIPFGGVIAALYFSTLPLWGYSLSIPEITLKNNIIILVSAFFFLMAFYRITVTGGLKDIDMENELNELKIFFNAKYIEEDNYYVSGYVPYYATSIILMELIVLANLMFYILSNDLSVVSKPLEYLTILLLILTYGIIFMKSDKMVSSKEWVWDTEEGYDEGYWIEIITSSAFSIVLLLIVGIVNALLILIIPALFAIIMKKVLYEEEY